MTKRALIIVMAVLCGGLALTPVAQAHPYLYYGPNDDAGNTFNPVPWASLYDVAAQFDTHLGGMMTPTTGSTSGCNLWIATTCGATPNTPIWTTVKGQQGPSWIGTDNGTGGGPGWTYSGSGSIDDRKIQMLDEVLSPASCLDGLALNTVNAVRSAFTSNKNVTLGNELTLYNIRIQASAMGGSADSTQTITTGGSTSDIAFKLLGITVYTITPQAIPNLWLTNKSLLRSANNYIRDAAVNMTAAYMTIGDTRLTNYWYSLMGTMGTVAINQMLPSLLAGIGKADTENLTAPDMGTAVKMALGLAMSQVTVAPGDTGNKAAVTCTPWGTVNDLNISLTVNVSGIGDVPISITTAGTNLCNSITNFAQKFAIGPGKYEGRAQYLATDATGNLNGDARLNSASYALAGGDANAYLQNESARPNFIPGTLANVPAGLTYGQTHTFTAAATYNGGTAGISYQWMAGPDAGSMTAIEFANGPSYVAPINFYSFNGVNNDRVYKCQVSVNCSGSAYVRETNAVTISGVAPPPISFSNYTGAGNYIPGAAATLSLDAAVGFGGPLTYQWQKFDGAAWVDIAGKTQKSLTINPVTPADAGQYRVTAFNSASKSDGLKANPMYWEVSNPLTIAVAPEIVIGTQPVGADLAINGSHTMTVAATVSSGTLSYQWQRNVGFGWQNIAGQITDTLALSNVTVNDAGSYRVKITNTEATFGTYSIYSSNAAVNVSSGAVYRVDPTATGPADGLTWPTAFTTLQAAIDAATNDAGGNGGEVWVAGGAIGAPVVYGEARTELWGNTPVDGSLVMKSNVAMYGGFEGYRAGVGAQETKRRDRNRFQNPTVIDGSVARAGSPAYHVVVFGTNAGPTNNASIDGFTITGGNAAGVAGDYHTWRGGALYNWQSAPKIANCTFYGNTAAVSGGAVSNETNSGNAATAQFINCLFYGNTANRAADTANNPIRGGGAVFNNMADAVFTFDTFAGNAIGDTAGYTLFGLDSSAIYGWEASPVISSSVAWGNLPAGAAIKGDIALGSTDAAVVAYTDAQGGVLAGTGNISADPLFSNAGANDYTLAAGSPAVDTADPVVAGDDLRGVPRPINGGLAEVSDMGAYELSPNVPAPVCLTQSINISAVTSITDALDVYDATNSVVEAGVWKIALLPNTFGCGDIPVKVGGVTVVVTDILGRTGSCSADVNVFEDTPPTVVTNPITVTLDASGAYTLTQTDVEAIGAGSTDNCTIDWAASSVSPATFGCAEAGTDVSVTITVKDASGNSATGSALVTVQDTTAPTAVGGNNIDVNLTSLGEYTLTFSDKVALGTGSTDACGINFASSSVSPAIFSCADLGAAVPVTLTLVDNNGNVAAPVAGTVTVHDVTPGVLSGIGAQAFVKDLGAYTTAQALVGVTASDLCFGDITASLVVTAFDGATPVAFPIPDTAPSYPMVYTLRYTATDGEGNSVYVDTQLTLVDNFPPVITLLGSNPETVECQAAYTDAGATVLDAESGDLTGVMGVVGLPVPTGTPGAYDVTYSVQDPITGVIVQKVRRVNVVDTSIPVISLVGSASMGWQRGVVFSDPGYSATDACAGTVPVTVTGTVDSNIAGTYTLTYNATDGFNAAVTQTRTVVVGDLVNFTVQPVGGDLYSTPVLSAPLTVTAEFENGVTPVSSYQWIAQQGALIVPLGSPAPVPAGNVLTLSIAANTPIPAGSYDVYVRVIDATGNNDSAHAVVRFGPHMSVGTGLTDVAFVEGDNYDWAIVVNGGIGALTYQWFAGSTPIADGGGITGANTNTLHFTPFAASMSGVYRVEVSDDNETITVGPATITVGSGVPVGSALGLAALAAMTALGGAASIRRRNK